MEKNFRKFSSHLKSRQEGAGLTTTTGSLFAANNQTIDYTAFNKASHIGQGCYDYFITYGTDRQRSMSRLTNLHRFVIRANILNTRSLTQLSTE